MRAEVIGGRQRSRRVNNQEMIRILDSIARDRNIDRELLIGDLEQAMASACRRHFGTLDAEEFACTLDPFTGELTITRHGEPLEIDPAELGRIAAQTFKQVMIQRFRDDERNSIFDAFSKRIGELATGVAQRYEGGALIVTIDRAEAFMPRSEQIPGEQFPAGGRVRCLILDVRELPSQVKIVISRAHPDFIRRLFEVEVPEVAERIIEIKGMAREPGFRTKIAVSSIDSKIDAVGACVGVRGSRIKNIVDELNGEKIDIVRWNESSQILIQNALKPAEDQLSLAIGKRGQNVRLAARLTGWDIDILTPEEFNKGLETLSETILAADGVTEEHVDRMVALGMVSVFDIEEVGAEALASELDISEEAAQRLVQIAAEKSKEVAERQEREKAESEARKAEEARAAEAILSGESSGPVDADTAAAAILGAGSFSAQPAQPSEDTRPEGDASPPRPETDAADSSDNDPGSGSETSPEEGHADHDARAADILGRQGQE